MYSLCAPCAVAQGFAMHVNADAERLRGRFVRHEGRATIAEVHRALLDAAAAGTVELRPEAGGEFLKEEDARLCPAGPRGTVLSYARLREP